MWGQGHLFAMQTKMSRERHGTPNLLYARTVSDVALKEIKNTEDKGTWSTELFDDNVVYG